MLRTEIESPTYSANYNDPSGPQDVFFPLPAVPYLKLAAVHDDKANTLTLFALNRSLTEELPLKMLAGGFKDLSVKLALQLRDPDLKAINTKNTPDRIAPRPLSSVGVKGELLTAQLAPASWNVVQLAAF